MAGVNVKFTQKGNSLIKISTLISVTDANHIYDHAYHISGGDHEEAANIQGWAELASIGEHYESKYFEDIEMIDEDREE